MTVNKVLTTQALSFFIISSYFIVSSYAADATLTGLSKKIEASSLALTQKVGAPLSPPRLAAKGLAAKEPIVSDVTSSPVANPVRVLLVPDKETTIASTIAARIVTFNGTLGRNFKAGETLVAFDCEEALARVEMSKAELSGAIEQHEAKVKMQGLEQASDVEVALAASASNKAKAQLNLNQAQVSQCKIYAPWAGRVAKTNVKNHMTVTSGQPLMELVKCLI